MKRNVGVAALVAGMLLAALPGLVAAATGTTSGEGVEAVTAWAGVGCKDLQYQPDDTEQGWTQVKIKKPASGTYDGIVLTVLGNSLDWSYEELYAVILKGGSLAYVYNYSLAGGASSLDVSSDTGLMAPINPKDIQVVTFCLEAEEPEL